MLARTLLQVITFSANILSSAKRNEAMRVLALLLCIVLATYHSPASDPAPRSCVQFHDELAKTACTQLLDKIQNLATFAEVYNRNAEFPSLANVRKDLLELAEKALDIALNPLLAVTYTALHSAQERQGTCCFFRRRLCYWLF